VTIRIVGLVVLVVVAMAPLTMFGMAQEDAPTPLQETITLQHRGSSVQILELPVGVYLARLATPGENKRSFYESGCVDSSKAQSFQFFLCPEQVFYSTAWETGYDVDCVEEYIPRLRAYERRFATWRDRRTDHFLWRAGGEVGEEPPDPGKRPEKPEFECASKAIKYAVPQTSGRVLGQDYGAVTLPTSTDLLVRVGEGGLSPDKQVLHIDSYNSWTLTIQPVQFDAGE